MEHVAVFADDDAAAARVGLQQLADEDAEDGGPAAGQEGGGRSGRGFQRGAAVQPGDEDQARLLGDQLLNQSVNLRQVGEIGEAEHEGSIQYSVVGGQWAVASRPVGQVVGCALHS